MYFRTKGAAALVCASALILGGGSATTAQAAVATTTVTAAPAADTGAAAHMPWIESRLGVTDTNLVALRQVDAFTTWAAGTAFTDHAAVPTVLVRDVRSGPGWRPMALPPTPSARLNGLDVSGPHSAVWVGDYNEQAGGVVTGHWDGTTWRTVVADVPAETDGAGLLAVDAQAADDAWAVGWAQVRTGETQPGPDGKPYPVSVFQPLLRHWDGRAWSTPSLPTLGRWASLSSVTMVARDDVWAVGDADGRSVVLHFDGTSWSRVDISAPSNAVGDALSSVVARGPADVWAFGLVHRPDRSRAGLALHFDGTAWTEVPLPTGTPWLHAATVTPTGVVAAGNTRQGAMALRYGDGAWHDLGLPVDPERPMLVATALLKTAVTLEVGVAREPTETEPMLPSVLTAFAVR